MRLRQAPGSSELCGDQPLPLPLLTTASPPASAAELSESAAEHAVLASEADVLVVPEVASSVGAPATAITRRVDLRAPSDDGNPLLDRVAMPIGGRTAATRTPVVIY
nr:hypothetical protein [Micromonospora sp. DSM 115978]